MLVHFWGSRGSLPASLASDAVETKIRQAVALAIRNRLADDPAVIDRFVRELPFAQRGTYGGNTSCVEVRGGSEFVICDAGSGLRDFGSYVMREVKAKRITFPCVFNIFLSHPHWDHIHGFPFFVPAYVPGNVIRIHGCHPDLAAVFEGQQKTPFFPVPLKAMRANIQFNPLATERDYDIAGFRVRSIRQNHPGDSYGYAFHKDERKIVYATDSEHKADVDNKDYGALAFFRDADLLIFDAQYTLADAIDVKENWGHSSNLLGVELAVRAGVRRLCMFHGEHTADDETLDRFLGDTRKYLRLYAEGSSLQIDQAYDGLEISV